MKQFTKIAVVCALAVSLAACGSSASSTAASSAASSEAASSVAASSEAASEAASSEAASVAEGEGYTGTQTASAKGMNGDVTVTITFENGVATACDWTHPPRPRAWVRLLLPPWLMPSWLATPPTWTL